jgi:hypothetical protein
MNNPPKMSIHACADVVVALQGPGRHQHEHHGIEVPLDFEPGVGAQIQRIANYRVRSAHDDREQAEPGRRAADALVEAVDQRAELEQRVHVPFLPVVVTAF